VPKTGWNFFYIKVDVTYGNTGMILGVVNEQYSPVKQTSTIYFDGDYAKDPQTFNIGCKVVNSV